MFVRNVSMHVHPDRATEFRQKVQDEIIPLLRRQKGFHEELLLVRPGESDVLAISLWDLEENAEAYARGTYPEVLETLGKLIDGTPEVETYEVAHSSLRAPNLLRHRGQPLLDLRLVGDRLRLLSRRGRHALRPKL